jgi:hypothetical protein
MSPLATVSRRTAVAATASLALSPRAEARERKKKRRRKKPLPPLATATIALTDVVPQATRCSWEFKGTFTHPDEFGAFSGNAFAALDASPDQIRAAILESTRSQVRNILLLGGGPDVPVGRIAVVLL